ncbi:hypothetical protein Aph01nite_39310 [Acrocarpospora phusangensis]|uniref:AAA+ ATPase domain-containing protein n=1 Tax=Acrocarpospora phusangensis TaxID=1070424 RepID=A0A919UL07_9ACTN|nr:hypothetical protein [Acrocarpospora phusangensis]GIH25621.1 hypothetical protein Aph01nite_39310 [Acrocarpospora phusangensis]
MGRMYAFGLVLAVAAATVTGGVAISQVLEDGRLSWHWTYTGLGLAVLVLLLVRNAQSLASRVPTLPEVEEQLARAVLVTSRAAVPPDASIPLRWAGKDVGQGQSVDALAQIFSALPVRRLLIFGRPGSGRTTFATQMLLSLLGARTRADPVPMLVGVADWNPETEHLHDWLAGRIVADYGIRPEDARALVAARRILPILDDFDLVPRRRRQLMISALEATFTSGEALIMTDRARELERSLLSRRSGLLFGGASVGFQPLSIEDVASYLVDHGGPGSRWRPLLDALVAEPGGVLAMALSTPLTLSLLRAVYEGEDGDPSELTDHARFPVPHAIRDHLLGRLVGARYQAARERPYRPEQIDRWLTFLAIHMNRRATRSLSWWSLPRALPPRLYGIIGAVAGAALILVAALAFRDWTGPPGWLSLLAAVAGAASGAGLAVTGRERPPNPLPGAIRAGSLQSPGSTIRADLARNLTFMAAVGLTVGVSLGFAQGILDGMPAAVRAGLVSGLAMASLAGLRTPVFAYLVAVVVFAARGWAPLRLMSFLRYAERLGVLRQVGPVYRFRYPELQDWLAGRYPPEPSWATSTDPAAELHEHEPAEGFALPSGDPVFPETSKIDLFTREKVREEAIVQPEVLLKIDDSDPARSRDALGRLIQRLLAANAETVEQAGDTQYQRYQNARKRLVDAARLPFWSRPAQLYRLIAWAAGGVAGWVAGMLWLPELAFRMVLIAGLVSWFAMAALRLLFAYRKQRSDGRDPEAGQYVRAFVVALFSPPPLVAAVCLACTVPFGKDLFDPASPPVAFWVACGVCVVATLLWLSSAPAAKIRTILASPVPDFWLQLPPGLAGFRVAAEQAYRDWVRALVREGLMPLLRVELEDERDAMAVVLPELDPGRLSGLSRTDEFVATEQTRYLERLIAGLGSASIGLSGSRGAGKSTALRQLCSHDLLQATANLRVLVHAPTAYDPREFVGHLFLRVCEQVTGEAGTRTGERGPRAGLAGLLPIATVLVGAVLLFGSLQWDRLQPFLAGLVADPGLLVSIAGGALLAGGLAAVWWSSRREPQVLGSSASEVAAHRHLRSLRYLQAVTETTTGEMALPGGSKLARQAAVQRTEHLRSYPQLVADLRELLGQIALDRQSLQGKVIIGIDELDKIGKAEDTERFLNDLKVVFGVHGCFFLVALSEDALAGYERRSLAIRNTFDSAFDRIVRIPRLRGSESRTLLARRGVPLPLPYVWLCHALTGGLPRDFLRRVLDLTTTAARYDDRDLPSLAARLIGQDLRAVAEAQLRVAAGLGDAHAPEITEWLATCAEAAPLTAAALDGLAEAAPKAAQGEPVVVQAHAHLLVLAALTRIFIEDPALLTRIRDDPDVIDRIAEARVLVATDPHLALHTIRRIRAETAFLISADP